MWHQIEFQEIMDNMATSADPSMYDKLSTLASDFTYVHYFLIFT
jgi:hypothetical protein